MEYRAFAKTGYRVSAVGMGTYYGTLTTFFSETADRPRASTDKVSALKKGIELGMNLIDTAEAYETEGIVAEAIQGFKRDELFVATKVWPSHLHYDDVLRSAANSMAKLKVAYVDLYQIHWPNGRIPIGETMKAMEKLVNDGKVRQIGVSNFSVAQMKEAQDAMSKHELASNQVEYSLTVRGIEAEVLPFCKKNNIAVIAYRPVAHGALSEPKGSLKLLVDEISKKHGGKTPAQVALNWLLASGDNVMPIPRASQVEHVIEDAGAAGWRLDAEEASALAAVNG